MTTVQETLIEANILLDMFASMAYAAFMVEHAEVVKRLRRNLKKEIDTVATTSLRLKQLEEVSKEIESLDAQCDTAKIRAIRTIRMVGDDATKKRLLNIPEFADFHGELQEPSKYSRSEAVSLRSFTSEYLRAAGPSKVGEIVAFLQWMGVKYAKRQSIEGVIKRNPETFRVTRKGREKFIDVKADE
ncbi:MAG: hypothetical protein ABSA78_17335 [Candidatus Sulfotelmatobacter sp.]|jgi:hypothetical protein